MECDRARAAQAAAEELAAGFERRRDERADAMSRAEVGRCKLTQSNPY